MPVRKNYYKEMPEKVNEMVDYYLTQKTITQKQASQKYGIPEYVLRDQLVKRKKQALEKHIEELERKVGELENKTKVNTEKKVKSSSALENMTNVLQEIKEVNKGLNTV